MIGIFLDIYRFKELKNIILLINIVKKKEFFIILAKNDNFEIFIQYFFVINYFIFCNFRQELIEIN